jgi:hypothetical protein
MQCFDGGHGRKPLRLGRRHVDRARSGNALHPSSAPRIGTIGFECSAKIV